MPRSAGCARRALPDSRRQDGSTPLHRRRHVPMHRLLPVRAHLRRAAGPVRVARARSRPRHRDRARRSDAARQLLRRRLRRLRRHLPDRRARGSTARRSPRPRVDPDDVPILRRRLRADVGTRDGRIVSVRPALDAPVSKGHLCVKGRYAFDFVSAADRITEPMIRDGSRVAAGVLERGAGVRRRPAAYAIARTGPTASASSDRRARRTRTTT